ncbi:MAG: DUF2254 domain-containing protein [Atopostipes suicloacalis]|nr:DUF2254 domain-containing protein [Atopostipes suicloacalis]
MKALIDRFKIFYRNNTIWVYLVRSILISIFLAIFVILIDSQMIPGKEMIPSFLLTSVGLAKLILSTLSGSLLTITTFTFSTIMVVLTTYSSNFSPRVVNNFLTDKTTMKVLGIFIGGFTYSILALFFMRNALSEFYVLSATIAVIYAIICILYFVVFVYRVSSSIQASKLINQIFEEAHLSIDEALEERENQTNTDEYEIGRYAEQLSIKSDQSGYLELIDFDGLFRVIKKIDGKLILKEEVGNFVGKGHSIAVFYYNEELDRKEILKELLKNFEIADERLAYHDYRFSLQKIVDITLRSLSPGINDPNTAIHCINMLGVLLGRIGEIEGAHTILKKENYQSDIIYKSFHFTDDLYYSFHQIIHYGQNDLSILIAILKALKNIKYASSVDKTAEINRYANYVYDNSVINFSHEYDRKSLVKLKNSI